MHGYGIYTWPDEAVYEGTFKTNKRHGKGKLIYGKSSKLNLEYEGEFQEDLRWGFGKLTTVKGVYEGHFQNGNFHGEGEFRFKNGMVKKGLWSNGVLQEEFI